LTDFLCKNICVIRAAVDDHNRTCKVPARAILLNPEEFEQLGVKQVWGIPVLPDERQRRRFFRVDCEGSASEIERELAEYMSDPLSVPVPITIDPAVERPLAAQAR
jgi:hypothetical protein